MASSSASNPMAAASAPPSVGGIAVQSADSSPDAADSRELFLVPTASNVGVKNTFLVEIDEEEEPIPPILRRNTEPCTSDLLFDPEELLVTPKFSSEPLMVPRSRSSDEEDDMGSKSCHLPQLALRSGSKDSCYSSPNRATFHKPSGLSHSPSQSPRSRACSSPAAKRGSPAHSSSQGSPAGREQGSYNFTVGASSPGQPSHIARLRTFDPLEDDHFHTQGLGSSRHQGCLPEAAFLDVDCQVHDSAQSSELPKAELDAHDDEPSDVEDEEAASASAAAAIPGTTVMLRNIPRCFHRDLLVALLEREGFGSDFDFLYFPYKFEKGCPEGYAFVNAVSEEAARRFVSHFTNFNRWGVPGNKKCTVGWSNAAMGLKANIERYRNSPVMHKNVPEHWKPLRRENGITIPFEAPSKTIKPPRKGTKLVRLDTA